jgi:four helix bundle protein
MDAGGSPDRMTFRDLLRFYNVAEASLEELKYFLLLSRDLAFLKEVQLISGQAETVSRLLYRFIESVQQNHQRTHPKS